MDECGGGYVLPTVHSHNSDPKLIRENSRTLHAGESCADRGWRYGDGKLTAGRSG